MKYEWTKQIPKTPHWLLYSALAFPGIVYLGSKVVSGGEVSVLNMVAVLGITVVMGLFVILLKYRESRLKYSKIIIDFSTSNIQFINETFLSGFWGNKFIPKITVPFDSIHSHEIIDSNTKLYVRLDTDAGTVSLSGFSEMRSLVDAINKVTETRNKTENRSTPTTYDSTTRNKDVAKVIHRVGGYICVILGLAFIVVAIIVYTVTGQFLVECIASIFFLFFGFVGLKIGKH